MYMLRIIQPTHTHTHTHTHSLTLTPTLTLTLTRTLTLTLTHILTCLRILLTYILVPVFTQVFGGIPLLALPTGLYDYFTTTLLFYYTTTLLFYYHGRHPQEYTLT